MSNYYRNFLNLQASIFTILSRDRHWLYSMKNSPYFQIFLVKKYMVEYATNIIIGNDISVIIPPKGIP